MAPYYAYCIVLNTVSINLRMFSDTDGARPGPRNAGINDRVEQLRAGGRDLLRLTSATTNLETTGIDVTVTATTTVDAPAIHEWLDTAEPRGRHRADAPVTR